jgi:hypothetical protein
MERGAVRAFARRDWERVGALKRAYHAQRIRGGDPDAGFLLAQRLREHVRGIRPDWPSARERADDLAHHLELKGKLERAARGFPGR